MWHKPDKLPVPIIEPDPQRKYWLGGMSGTSTDGVDVSLLVENPLSHQIQFVGLHSEPFSPGLRQALLKLQSLPADMTFQEDWLLPMLKARQALSDIYANAASKLLNSQGIATHEVAAFGVHGQTLRHRPDLAITYQLMDASRLAVKTGVPVVYDFRSHDVALGGQGAPLVPSFHAFWLGQANDLIDPGHRVAVLNLGGFSNLTLLDKAGKVLAGGDCGPANVLLDAWCSERFGVPFDAGGELATSGVVNQPLLLELQSHPFFEKPWPKSTGRDDFNLLWLESKLVGLALPDVDVLSTLVALSAWAVHQCLPAGRWHVVLAGGGALNQSMVSALSNDARVAAISRFSAFGLPEQAVEACAFAWFANQFFNQLPITSLAVTGAIRETVSGSLCLP